MKLRIKQSILMENLNNVIKGISTKNLIPILGCIKFDLTDDGLYLFSTDNEIGIKTFIDKKNLESIDELGSIVISGRYIYEIIRKMPNDIITIEEVLDSKVYIYRNDDEQNSSSVTLNCKNPIPLDKKILKNIITQTSFASSNQESRPVLTGINFKINNDVLECNATDSYRLSKKIVKLDVSLENNVNIIIPTKNLNELVKMINDDENKVNMHIFNNKVIFEFDNILMMTTLINGSYPDISKLIPESYLLEVDVDINEFYNALDRASLFTNLDEKNTVNIEVFDNKLKVYSNTPEIGNGEEYISATKKGDEKIKISFSSKFMMEALKAFGTGNVTLCFNGELKPIIIKSNDNQDLTELIVPIRIA